MSQSSTPSTRRVRFQPRQAFSRTLNKRVESYFKDNQISKNDSPSLYLKTGVLFTSLLTCWALLTFGTLPAWAFVIAVFGVGLSVAGIGFNVMHDGGHKSFSKKRWVNRVMAYSSDFVGASSYFWDVKHNHYHHTYVNVYGHDDDIDLGILGRLSPERPRLGFHRFQHIYMWFLYAFATMKWNFYDDFHCYLTRKLGDHDVERPKGTDWWGFVLGKAFFFSWAIVIPAFIHPIGAVLGVYFAASAITGITLAVVFQLAHLLEEAAFPSPDPYSNKLADDWAVHQIRTTVNFSPSNPIVSWYVGGLNYQIEHHLFPKICHVHYPKLSKIVQETCEEYGIVYQCHSTMWQGLLSHYRKLWQLGRPDVKAEQKAA